MTIQARSRALEAPSKPTREIAQAWTGYVPLGGNVGKASAHPLQTAFAADRIGSGGGRNERADAGSGARAR